MLGSNDGLFHVVCLMTAQWTLEEESKRPPAALWLLSDRFCEAAMKS